MPSLTETICDLGAGRTIVGITDFCIFPAGLTQPRLGGTKNPRIDEIHELAPDLVHMNLEENLERHAHAIEEFAPVFVTEPKQVEDVLTLIGTLGAIHRSTERAAELCDQLQETMESTTRHDFTFACAIWKEPWMWCGSDTYVSSLVTAAGGRNVIKDARYPTRDLETLRADIIFLPDEPYAFRADDAEEVRRQTGADVVGPFPGHLFTWHGTRTRLGLEFLELRLQELLGPRA